jgi:hypothetical protein
MGALKEVRKEEGSCGERERIDSRTGVKTPEFFDKTGLFKKLLSPQRAMPTEANDQMRPLE